jgi:transglutaminase superfamily protein
MGTLASFLRLRSADQRLVVQAAGLMMAVRVGLWTLPLQTLLRTTRALGDRPQGRHERGGPPVERIIWAVSAADRVIPQSTCLVRALAAQVLLARRGHASQLRLGVAGVGGRAFEAHAWLEQGDHVLIGGPIEGRYAPLLPLDAPR